MAIRPDQPARSERSNRLWFRLLLLIPFVVLLWPPFYNFKDPVVLGFPFFYWFQLFWIIITAIITALVYFVETRE